MPTNLLPLGAFGIGPSAPVAVPAAVADAADSEPMAVAEPGAFGVGPSAPAAVPAAVADAAADSEPMAVAEPEVAGPAVDCSGDSSVTELSPVQECEYLPTVPFVQTMFQNLVIVQSDQAEIELPYIESYYLVVLLHMESY